MKKLVLLCFVLIIFLPFFDKIKPSFSHHTSKKCINFKMKTIRFIYYEGETKKYCLIKRIDNIHGTLYTIGIPHSDVYYAIVSKGRSGDATVEHHEYQTLPKKDYGYWRKVGNNYEIYIKEGIILIPIE